MVKRAWRPFYGVGWLCWISWKMKEGHSTGQMCWLFRWKCMCLIPGIHLRMRKRDSICLHSYLMQYVPNINFLAWVGHGHHHMMLWKSIASFSLSEVTEDSCWIYLTTSSPQSTRWYSSRIHLACTKKWCRHCLTLKIGMPHSMAPSLGCLVERSLCMCYQGFPWIS